MVDVYPKFKYTVEFYAVGSDPTESLNDLLIDHDRYLYPGIVSVPVGRMLRDLEVFSQSTKIAIDADGVIVYRAGYGRGGPVEWREVFQKLTDSIQ
jgi:hypothetical protein